MVGSQIKGASITGALPVTVISSEDIDKVISPAIGGIVVGFEVGRLLKKETIFAERQEKKLLLRRGFKIKE